MEALALQRGKKGRPTELIEGAVYAVTLNDGTECKLTPYNMRVQIEAHGPIDAIDKVGPIRLEAVPDGETPGGGWGDVEDAKWDGGSFIRPLLGSTPREEVSAEQLALLIASRRQAELVDQLRTANPGINITRAAVAAALAAESAASKG